VNWNFFKKKEAEVFPKIRVVGLQLRLSGNYSAKWLQETISQSGEDKAMKQAEDYLKQCQQAIEDAERYDKFTALLPGFGLIRVDRFEEISYLLHDKA
jgi:hypothetical protein